MSARERQQELVEIVASGLERAVAERAGESDADISEPGDSGVDGLELLAGR